MRGRPRKPTAIKKLGGEKRPSRIPKHEPEYRLVEPPPPKDLDKIARGEWKRAAKILADVGVLTEADLAVLHGYCTAWSEYIRMQARLRDEGEVIEEQRGTNESPYWISKRNPAYDVMLQSRKHYLEFGRELGLSPVARQKVKAADKPEEGGELVAFDGGKR